MGGVKRDIHEKGRSYDEKYPYKKAGIERLMYDYWSIKDSQGIKGDVDSVALLADLERALDNCPLTPRMRQVLALKYFAGLNVTDAATILGVPQQTVSLTVDRALNRLESFMSRGESEPLNARCGGAVPIVGVISLYISLVGRGAIPIYRQPNGVTEWLSSKKGDKKAQETLKQRVAPVKYVSTEEARPLTKRQMRYGDKRTVYVEDVYPREDVAGARKASVRLREDPYGREFKLEKQRIFIRNGCF